MFQGRAIRQRCEELGWEVVDAAVVPDEAALISERIRRWVDETGVSVVLTTGGTGVSARDVTPEATRFILDREIPGIGELMRSKGMEQTIYSSLSRAVAGTRGKTLIINLPGSPRGALHSLAIIESLTQHAVQLLAGRTEHDGQ